MRKRPKIEKLKVAVSKELGRMSEKAHQLHEAAAEVARSASVSPSQSGDRYHAQGQADIAREQVNILEKIYTEIDQELEKGVASEIRPVCWVEAEFVGGEKDEFYYLNEPLALSEYKFVSSKSLFGIVLSGKKAGDNFEFVSDNIKRSGKIVKVE